MSKPCDVMDAFRSSEPKLCTRCETRRPNDFNRTLRTQSTAIPCADNSPTSELRYGPWMRAGSVKRNCTPAPLGRLAASILPP